MPSAPGKRLSLAISRDRLSVTLELLPAPGEGEAGGAIRPALEDVLAELDALGVRAEVDREAVLAALEGPPGAAVVVARGVPPVEGEHGRVEILFPTEVARMNPGEDMRKVDWRARLVFPQTVPGQELAVLHPPIPGVPGRAVTGEEIPPPKVHPAFLLAGPGVEVVPAESPPGGAVAVATEAGMPVATRQGRNVLVKVAPLVTLPGDVDLGTGNVKVQGSVAVEGSVREGCAVVASESVVVRGDVDAAEVTAGRDVTVAGQVMGARIRAGGERGLRLLVAEFDRFLAACRQVVGSGAGCGDAVRLLLRSKFAHLRKTLDAGGQGPDERGWIEEARRLLLQPAPSLVLDQVEDLGRRLRLIYQDEAAGSIRAAYVQNATLQAAGAVSIGRGCFFADIVAGGGVVVEGTFRAGRIVAGGNVSIGEAGSPAEASCEIEVPKDAVVSFRRVHPGVIVRFGTLAYRFEAPYEFVTLRAGPDGVEWS